MSKILLTFSFICISFIGFCDTLDFYHVYLNDSLIGQFNLNSDKASFEFNTSKIKDTDSVIVRHVSDSPCVNCTYVLSVLIEVKEKTPEAKTNKPFGKLSIPSKELIYFKNKYDINEFHFNYSKKSKDELNNYEVYLFSIKFIEDEKE